LSQDFWGFQGIGTETLCPWNPIDPAPTPGKTFGKGIWFKFLSNYISVVVVLSGTTSLS
jgi:hypothetical protein